MAITKRLGLGFFTSTRYTTAAIYTLHNYSVCDCTVKLPFYLILSLSYLKKKSKGTDFVEYFNAINDKCLKHSLNVTQLSHEQMIREVPPRLKGLAG